MLISVGLGGARPAETTSHMIFQILSLLGYQIQIPNTEHQASVVFSVVRL